MRARVEVDKILGAMNAALRSRHREIQHILAKATKDEVDARYSVGAVVRDIMEDEGKYGAGAVVLLAGALGRKKSTLYNYASVARTWSARELASLVRQRDVFGEPLSWSHLVELAKVEDPRRRAALARRALDEGLSTRELATLVEGRPALPPTPRGTPLTTESIVVFTTSVREAMSRWDLTMGATPRDDVPKVLDAIEAELNAHRELLQALEEHGKRLDAVRSQAIHMLAGQTAKNGVTPMLLAGSSGQ